MTQRSLRLIGRALIVLAAWFSTGISSVQVQDDADDGTIRVPAAGTEGFRLMLNKLGIDPLDQVDAVKAAPAKTIIILLGGESVRKYLTDDIQHAVQHGAALLIATDRSTSRSSLRRLFGVEVTGDTVIVDPKDGYEGRPFWPFVRPKGTPLTQVPKNSPLEFFNKLEPVGPDGLATCNSSVIKRNWLDGPNAQMTPLEGIAGYPLSAETSRHGNLDPAKDFFAVGGNWSDGQVIVLGDHSLFCNELFLAVPPAAEKNANAVFSSELINWMQTTGKEPRTQCLFVEEGKIQPVFDIFPDLDLEWWEQFNFIAEGMNHVVPEWEEQNVLNEFFLGFLNYNQVLVRSVLRWTLIGLSILFLLYCFLRMIGSRVKADPCEHW